MQPCTPEDLQNSDIDDEWPAPATEALFAQCSCCNEHRKPASILALFAFLIAASFCYGWAKSSVNLPHSGRAAHGNISIPKLSGSTRRNVVELLHSKELTETAVSAALHLGELLATTQQGKASEKVLTASSVAVSQTSQLPSPTTVLRAEAKHSFKTILGSFFDSHPEATHLLSSVHVSSKEAADIILMLKALTDQRIFDVGITVGGACASSATTHSHFEGCLQKQSLEEAPRLRQLRQELLPNDLWDHFTATLSAPHMMTLRRRAFKTSAALGSWRAELEVRSRRLARLPLNWFTIGAPILSNTLGLVFLSLMSLLPGARGFPTNRGANYALWGLQGAATLGECLVNIEFPKGILYFASCATDVLFLGMEVIWVFFNGDRVAGPTTRARCSTYTLWPRLRGVCGNCMGLVLGSRFESRCDIYCSSFNHKALFAAFAVPGSCEPRGRYDPNEPIPYNTMLCQCALRERKLAHTHIQHNSTNEHAALSQQHQEYMNGLLTPDSSLERRRLQSSTSCQHNFPYVIQVITSFQANANNSMAPTFALKLAGEFTIELDFNASTTRLGDVIQSGPLFLRQPPEMLRITATTGTYGWSRIVLMRGPETTDIITSDNGEPFGNNRYWVAVGNLLVPSNQTFNISGIKGTSSIPSSTRQSGMYTLEIVTAGREYSALSGPQIRALFIFQSRLFIQEEFIPEGTQVVPLECRSLTVSTGGHRPSSIILSFLGSGQEWGYRAVYLVDDDNGVSPLLESDNGMSRGQNAFWIGNSSSDVRISQTFTVPDFTTTSTTTTSTRTGPYTTTSTSSASTSSSTVTAPIILYQCPTYAHWPSILGVVCGGCEALVAATAYDGRCDRYCSSFGLECVAAADDTDGTCLRRNPVDCQTQVPNAGSAMLCTCQARASSFNFVPQQCSSYTRWPQIDLNVCGSCRAIVPLGLPGFTRGSTCSKYCSSFGHTCLSAAIPASTDCSIGQILDCSEKVERAASALCTCLRPI